MSLNFETGTLDQNRKNKNHMTKYLVGPPPFFRRKPYMVEIHSTVEKRAKRMPDTTVETNFSLSLTVFLQLYSS